MFSTVSAVAPVFALIFVGWLARRVDALGPNATSELNRFVVYLALPALLFDIVANAHWSDVWQPGFIAAFGLSGALVFGLTVALQRRCRRDLADATIEGLNAGYANTGFIGFPLALATLGREAMAPTLIATIITVCVLFSAAIVLIEIGRRTKSSPLLLALEVGRSLIRNPLLVAPAAATLIPLFGLRVPDPAESFLKLLGAAASPCALVALGLFLARERNPRSGDSGLMALLVGLKLLGQPAIAWLCAAALFHLSPALTHAAVLLAALPTGTGPFMLAEFYGRDAEITASVVLISTIASVFTISAYLAFAR